MNENTTIDFNLKQIYKIMNTFLEIQTAYQVAGIFITSLIFYFAERSTHGYFLKRDNMHKQMAKLYENSIDQWKLIVKKYNVKFEMPDNYLSKLQRNENTINNIKDEIKIPDTRYHFWAAFYTGILFAIIAIVLWLLGYGYIKAVIGGLLFTSNRWWLDLWLNKIVGWGLFIRGKDNPFDKVPFIWRGVFTAVLLVLLFIIK